MWFTIVLLFNAILGSSAGTVHLYVSPTGSDSNSGLDTSHPLKTIHKARDKLEDASIKDNEVYIELMQGYHDLSSTLTFTHQHPYPVTIRSYQHQEVHVTGGKRIASNQFKYLDTKQDSAAMSLISARGLLKVRRVNLKDVGITDFGRLEKFGFYSRRTAPLEVFINGKPLRLAEWPDNNFINIKSIPNGRNGTTFTYNATRDAFWSREKDPWVYGFWYWSWADHSAQVKKVDSKAHEITLTAPTHYGLRTGNLRSDGRHYINGYSHQGGYFRVFNMLSELDQPLKYNLLSELVQSVSIIYMLSELDHSVSIFYILSELDQSVRTFYILSELDQLVSIFYMLSELDKSVSIFYMLSELDQSVSMFYMLSELDQSVSIFYMLSELDHSVSIFYILSELDQSVRTFYILSELDQSVSIFYMLSELDQSVNIFYMLSELDQSVSIFYMLSELDQSVSIFYMLSELDQSGEYYLDRTTGILYIWPNTPKGDLKDTDVVYVSLINSCISLSNGIKNMNFEDFTLEACRHYGIEAQNGHNLKFSNLEVKNTGTYGISCSGDCRSVSVSKCEIHDSDGGIKISGGNRKTLTSSGNIVEDNHIHHFGRASAVGSNGISVSGVNNIIKNNHMHHCTYTGIYWTGNDHVFEYNHIHDCCYNSTDCGAFMTGRDWTFRGNIIRYNYLHDHVRYWPGAEVRAVMLDDQMSSITMEKNIFAHNEVHANIGGGRDNIFSYNVFYESRSHALDVDGRGHAGTGGNSGSLDTKLKAMPYTNSVWASKYPKLAAMAKMDAKSRGAPAGNQILHNLYVMIHGKKTINYHGSFVMNTGYFNHVDNHAASKSDFVSPEHNNFELRCQAKDWANKANFPQPVSYDKVGPRYPYGPRYFNKGISPVNKVYSSITTGSCH
ncbi:hypothetical protein LOTGIDRAFT_232078 [Lottia gigantea]|uniref:Right handed beta helix domain-containing protein n=1 Tax=Lottia gigantea TaxID=225164 RepID=V4C1S6_LOTGI|nr:hypothetical protein LOTGIDRAFT_232078 [Lottia gigantea]ESO95404.1 hypothetical protein LOTGIDRAFT_232078 [Lottia gigantea]